MYPIATEKGISKDGKNEYDVFGVRLESSKGRLKLLRELRLKSLFMRDLPLMKKILTENLRDEIISSDMLSVYSRTNFEPFDWGTVRPKDISSNGITLVSLYGYIDVVRYCEELRGICEGLKEMLVNWDRNGQFTVSSTNILVNEYLDTVRGLGLEMHQDTPSRIMRGSSTDLTSVYSNLSIAKSNAIMLMLLTGKNTYTDLYGVEKPIVISKNIRSLEAPKDDEARLKYVTK